VARLNAAPATLHVADPAGGPPVAIRLTGDAFAGLVALMSGNTGVLPQVPAIIYDAREDNFRRLQALLAQMLPRRPDPNFAGITLGANLAVLCADEAPFTSRAQIQAAQAPYPL